MSHLSHFRIFTHILIQPNCVFIVNNLNGTPVLHHKDVVVVHRLTVSTTLLGLGVSSLVMQRYAAANIRAYRARPRVNIR